MRQWIFRRGHSESTGSGSPLGFGNRPPAPRLRRRAVVLMALALVVVGVGLGPLHEHLHGGDVHSHAGLEFLSGHDHHHVAESHPGEPLHVESSTHLEGSHCLSCISHWQTRVLMGPPVLALGIPVLASQRGRWQTPRVLPGLDRLLPARGPPGV